MPTWHIIDRRQLLSLMRMRRWYAILWVALGVGGGLMLARSESGIAFAQEAATVGAPYPIPQRDWCEPSQGLRMSCMLQAAR